MPNFIAVKTIIGLVLLFLSISGFASSIYIGNNTDFVQSKGSGVKPGDTIFVMAGHRGGLHLARFKGKLDKPIVIINYNGLVSINAENNDGIKLNECEHIILSGVGDERYEYGFKITSTHSGIQAFNKSTNIEISNIEIGGADIGILFKSNGVDRSKFVQYNTVLHHNYIHDITREGFYVGSSFYTQGKDHLLEGVRIYQNKIENTGWDSLQVGSATNCEIRGNQILNDSQSRQANQMGGITINPGAQCEVFNNKIIDGEGPGIIDQGLGDNHIYNNLIIRPGLNGNANEPRGLDGIIVLGVNRNYSKGNSIFIYNNTIIEPKHNGISFGYDEAIQGDKSVIANNIIYNPGGLEFRKEAYIETMRNPIFKSLNNIFTSDLNDIQFKDYSSGDFSIAASSPAINAGFNLSNVFDFDITGKTRNRFDIGAFEFH